MFGLVPFCQCNERYDRNDASRVAFHVSQSACAACCECHVPPQRLPDGCITSHRPCAFWPATVKRASRRCCCIDLLMMLSSVIERRPCAGAH